MKLQVVPDVTVIRTQKSKSLVFNNIFFCIWVTVKSKQPSSPKYFENTTGMTTTAKGGIHIGATPGDLKSFYAFF